MIQWTRQLIKTLSSQKKGDDDDDDDDNDPLYNLDLSKIPAYPEPEKRNPFEPAASSTPSDS